MSSDAEASPVTPWTSVPSERDRRAAAVAAVLAEAVRDGRVPATDALRIIKHEMRRRNTNRKGSIEFRSAQARAVEVEYATRGEKPPNNNSPDALHADHAYEFGEQELRALVTEHDWLVGLERLRTVVVVTASENYDLEQLERAGVRGPAKYAAAGLMWDGPTPLFLSAVVPD